MFIIFIMGFIACIFSQSVDPQQNSINDVALPIVIPIGNNCSPNCNLCDADNNCLECIAGYGFDTQKNNCFPCPANCYACDNQNSCTTCNQGYNLINGKTCEVDFSQFQCPLNCKTCLGSTQCIDCSNSYWLDTTSSNCLPCSSNCKTCTNDSECQQCIDGYTLNDFKACEPSATPSAIPIATAITNTNNSQCLEPNCLECRDDNACTRCELGYYIDEESKCSSCVENCQVCMDSLSCFTCDPGYELTEDFMCQNTLVCPENCLQCQDNSTCIICNDGYYYYPALSSCIPCESGCKACNSSTTCLQCENGLSLTFGGSCVNLMDLIKNSASSSLCPPNCSVCNQSNNTCMTCNEGYALNSTGQCQPSNAECDFACVDCQEGVCSGCQDGYYLNNYSVCAPCAPNCLTCQDYEGVCITCADNSFPVKGQCRPTTDSCEDISCTLCDIEDSYICYQCIPGYYLNITSSVCLGCPIRCLNCENGLCITCDSNSQLIDGSCILISNEEELPYCPIGYYPTVDGCQACRFECSSCIDQYHCNACYDGYVLKNNSCVIEQDMGVVVADSIPSVALNTDCENCLNCTSNNTCLACPAGYLLLSTGICAACPSNCYTCTNLLECQVCNENYELIQGNCMSISNWPSLEPIPATTGEGETVIGGSNTTDTTTPIICDPNCLTCDIQGCQVCQNGYALGSQLECVPCPVGCNMCEADGSCTSCHDNFKVVAGNCEPITCPQGCVLCSSETYCNTCDIGFYLNPYNLCTKCPQNCTACSNSQQCTACTPGWMLTNPNLISIFGINEADSMRSLQPTSNDSPVICQRCLDNCLDCDGLFNCNRCIEGYQIFKSGKVKFCAIIKSAYKLSALSMISLVMIATITISLFI